MKAYSKYILLVVILLALDWFSGSVISMLAQKQARDNRIGLLLSNKINADIIILGSSRALNNYNPRIIADETGSSCYNLGVSGSNILFHETLLDLIISQEHKPELIVYNIDDYGALCKMDGIIYRKDVLYPFVDNPIVSSAVSRELKKNNFVARISLSYRHNVNFINSVKYLAEGREIIDYTTTNFDSLGANLLIQRPQDNIPKYGSQRRLTKMPPLEEVHVEALKRIQQKCRLNGISLMLSLPPLYMPSTPGFEEKLNSLVASDVNVVSFAQSLQDSSFFFNSDHLNIKGADAFSKLISDEIKKVKY